MTDKGRLCKRYEYLFLLMLITVILQLYMEYTFYISNQREINKIHALVESKVIMHDVRFHAPEENRSSNPKLHQIKVFDTLTEAKEFHILDKKDEDLPYYSPMCEIQEAVAITAIEGARTNRCKQQIGNATCQNQAGQMFALSLPRYCPLKGGNGGQYLGCFQDDISNRMLSIAYYQLNNVNTVKKCIDFCLASGTNYAGLQFQMECWCGNVMRLETQIGEERCNYSCPGNKEEKCGGDLALNVYETGFGTLHDNPAPLVDSDTSLENSVRIVFLLTIRGRALRQVKQLLRIIYQPNHFYYIQIDASEIYMYIELQALQHNFDNVILTRSTKKSIEMGPNTLGIYLESFKELLAKTEWKWDYVINLSETDFPMRKVNDLTSYLTTYRGLNFLEKLNQPSYNLMANIGLNKIFVECDDHVWKIGDRHMPSGLYLAGGPDSFSLSRAFIDYIINSEDDLMQNLKQYYTYSVLPTQSFFTVALLNSMYCGSFVDNNLHFSSPVSDSQRCQCPLNVDWCGCSPLVYRHVDLGSLLAQKQSSKFTFLGRQFEGVICQSVINEMENNILIDKPKDLNGRDSFWLNIFHHKYEQVMEDAYLSYYHSFIRHSLSNLVTDCDFKLLNIWEVNVFSHQDDDTKGLIIQYEVQATKDKLEKPARYILETYVEPLVEIKQYDVTGPVNTFNYAHVGTLWDPKGEIFRNYGNLMGPNSNISLVIHWKNNIAGADFTMSVIYVDPALAIAGSFELAVKQPDRASQHTPNFKGPLRPGLWRVQLLFNWKVFAQCVFVIIPITHQKGVPISENEANILHAGPPDGIYVQQDLSFLNITNDKTIANEIAKQNALKTGSNLANWADELSNITHKITEMCVSSDLKEFSQCDIHLPECEQTFWSSLYPDPKSDLTDLYRRYKLNR